MKNISESIRINKDSKLSKPDLYSFYEDDSDIREGDNVLFACKCGDGGGILVKCIVNKITYSKFNGKTTDKIFNVSLKLDDDRGWIKNDNTIQKFIDDGVSGYKINRQLLKLED